MRKMVDILKNFRLRRLSAPQAINYGYYKVKKDQNFDFLYANVKALRLTYNNFLLKFLVELLRCALS